MNRQGGDLKLKHRMLSQNAVSKIENSFYFSVNDENNATGPVKKKEREKWDRNEVGQDRIRKREKSIRKKTKKWRRSIK